MARNDGSAYDAACREAHAIVEGVIASILDGSRCEKCERALPFYEPVQWRAP